MYPSEHRTCDEEASNRELKCTNSINYINALSKELRLLSNKRCHLKKLKFNRKMINRASKKRNRQHLTGDFLESSDSVKLIQSSVVSKINDISSCKQDNFAGTKTEILFIINYTNCANISEVDYHPLLNKELILISDSREDLGQLLTYMHTIFENMEHALCKVDADIRKMSHGVSQILGVDRKEYISYTKMDIRVERYYPPLEVLNIPTEVIESEIICPLSNKILFVNITRFFIPNTNEYLTPQTSMKRFSSKNARTFTARHPITNDKSILKPFFKWYVQNIAHGYLLGLLLNSATFLTLWHVSKNLILVIKKITPCTLETYFENDAVDVLQSEIFHGKINLPIVWNNEHHSILEKSNLCILSPTATVGPYLKITYGLPQRSNHILKNLSKNHLPETIPLCVSPEATQTDPVFYYRKTIIAETISVSSIASISGEDLEIQRFENDRFREYMGTKMLIKLLNEVVKDSGRHSTIPFGTLSETINSFIDVNEAFLGASKEITVMSLCKMLQYLGQSLLNSFISALL